MIWPASLASATGMCGVNIKNPRVALPLQVSVPCMRRHALTLSLALLGLAVTLGGAAAAYRVERHTPPATFQAAAPADTHVTRIQVLPLTRGITTIHVLVRQGTVRLERDSLAVNTLQTRVPATLIVSAEATWLQVRTHPEAHAVELRIAGVTLKAHERPPWGRILTMRKVDGRWQAETMYLPADSVRPHAQRGQ